MLEWIATNIKIMPGIFLWVQKAWSWVLDFLTPPLDVNFEIYFDDSNTEPISTFLKIVIRNKKHTDLRLYDFKFFIGDEENDIHFLRQRPHGYFQHKLQQEEQIDISAKKVEIRYIVFINSVDIREKYEAGNLYFAYKSAHNGKNYKINVKKHIEQNKKEPRKRGAGQKALPAGGKTA